MLLYPRNQVSAGAGWTFSGLSARNALQQQSSPARRVTAVSEMSRARKESSQVLAQSDCRHNATEVGLCSPSDLVEKGGVRYSLLAGGLSIRTIKCTNLCHKMLHKMSAYQRVACELYPNEAGVVAAGGPGGGSHYKRPFCNCNRLATCFCLCVCVWGSGAIHNS